MKTEKKKKYSASFGLCQSQKHLGMILDPKVTLEDPYKKVLSETNRTIGPLYKLQNLLLRTALIIISKAFIRLDHYFNDDVFDQAFNPSFQKTIKPV